MQLLNIVLGGTLYQDIAEQFSGTLNHCRRDLPRATLTHTVQIEAGSLVEKIMGTRQISVNSLHHQAVKDLGQGVRITGRSEDDLAEILELPGHRFVVAVQCHPEEIYTEETAFDKLFRAFVCACSTLPAEEAERSSNQLAQARP